MTDVHAHEPQPAIRDEDLLRADDLSRLTSLRHAFFTRRGGVSEGIYAGLNGGLGSNDDPRAVAENRARMAGTLGVAPDRFLTIAQIHSADVVTVDAPYGEEGRPRADGIVTRTPGLALGVTHADCGSLLFADPAARVVGAAHAGWKGALSGIVEATVDAMERLGAERESIIVVLGPTIGPRSYEVGPEFVQRLAAADGSSVRHVQPGAGADRALFDLPGYIAHRARAAEVGAFVDMALDTYPDEDRFFSYRRTTHRGEPDYGRLVSAIVLA